MLQPTITSASTKATISSQVTGEPQALKAGERAAGAQPGAAMPVSGALRARVRCCRRADLHQDLVGLDHAEFGARLLLDHLQAFLQVGHFGGELVVARPGGAVFLALALEPVASSSARGTPPRPSQSSACTSISKHGQDDGDDAHAAPGVQRTFGAVSAQVVERAAAGVARDVAQVFLDAQQLVVLGDAVAAAAASRS